MDGEWVEKGERGGGMIENCFILDSGLTFKALLEGGQTAFMEILNGSGDGTGVSKSYFYILMKI